LCCSSWVDCVNFFLRFNLRFLRALQAGRPCSRPGWGCSRGKTFLSRSSAPGFRATLTSEKWQKNSKVFVPIQRILNIHLQCQRGR
jgi:hypothetical protein